jgi:hypothetical protein
MGPSAIVIFACDARYFALACELLESIQSALPTRPMDLGMLDLGLLPEQRRHFANAGVQIVTPDWDIPGIRLPADQNWYKAMTSRPFLPRHFPHHDILMWLDSDCWVQRGEALELFLRGAERYGFAIVPELHRSYYLHYRGTGALVQHRQAYEQAFGPQDAARLIQLPILNSGAFAARRTSATWGLWAQLCQRAMSRGPTKHSEQAALNAALYRQNGVPFHPLPASCNWICPLSRPLWDSESNQFVEPVLPHEPLGLIHLCNPEFHQPMEVACLTGNPRHMGFRRKFVLEALRSQPPSPPQV